MSIGRLIKKATSILLIVAMVMTSAGIHTLANSIDAVVEMAKEEKSENLVENNQDELLNPAEEKVENEEENSEEGEKNEEEKSQEEENKEDSQDEVEENFEEEISEEPEEEEETVEETTAEETTAEETTAEETTVDETTAEETTAEEETTVEETVVEEAKETIASASDALFGDGVNTFTLTYNYNDYSAIFLVYTK